MEKKKQRAGRNRTLTLSEAEQHRYGEQILYSGAGALRLSDTLNRVICGDMCAVAEQLPRACADLLFLDPPYNLSKDFHGNKFGKMSHDAYCEYLDSMIRPLIPLLKPGASIYLCGDWQCTAADYEILARYFTVRNRITWQREKGRGSRTNWKNACEDIWFATCGDDYFFDVEAVKVKKPVIAPYRENGVPKDWEESPEGRFRMTHPGNFWDDLTVPYWSMPENTDHPTQKPEKLLAKLILASSRPGDVILDPFLGSGTAAVTAKKLGRNFIGIEQNPEYCMFALARLERAEQDQAIQGFENGVFLARGAHFSR